MTQKPIKATLDSSDDSVKTQKPILIQLDDIPTPEVGDAGKVLGVDESGKYALTEGGEGGGEEYDFDIFYTYHNDAYSSVLSSYTVNKSLTREKLVEKYTNKEPIHAKMVRRYVGAPDEISQIIKEYPAIFTWYSYDVLSTGFKLHFNEIKTSTLSQVTLTFDNDGVLTGASTS